MNPSIDQSRYKTKILIIVPAFNEEGSIVKTIEDILNQPLDVDCLVIDDGSADRTSELVRTTKAHLIQLPFNLGIGGAVQTGFLFAQKHQYDVAVQVDGDGQHPTEHLAKIIKPILKGECDIAIGSRFVPPLLGYQSSFVRRIGINFFSHMLALLTEYSIKDVTSGFRAYNRQMIEVFSRYYPLDFPEPEAIVIAGKIKANICEVPVKMTERVSGHSSIRYLKTLYYMIKVTCAIFLHKMRSYEHLQRFKSINR